MKNKILSTFAIAILLSYSFFAFANRMPSRQTFMIIQSDVVVFGTISKIDSLYIYLDVKKSTATCNNETIKIINPNIKTHYRRSSANLIVGQTWILPLKKNEQYSFVDLLDFGLSSNGSGFYCHTNYPSAYLQTKDIDLIFDAIKLLKTAYTTGNENRIQRKSKKPKKDFTKNKIAAMWFQECETLIQNQK